MAVDTYFDAVSLLVQGGSTANAANGGVVATPAGVTVAADHIVFGPASSLVAADPSKALGVYYGFGLNEALDTTSMELVFEHAWAPHANLFRTQKVQVRGHASTQNRYEVFVRGVAWNSAFTAKMTEFDLPASGRVMLYATTGGVDSFVIVPETGAPVTLSNFGGLTFSYPVLLGSTGETLSASPTASQASISNVVDVLGSSGVSTPAILLLSGPSFSGRPSNQTPSSGSATLSIAGVTTSVNVAGMASAAIASVLAAQAANLINAGSVWSASAQAMGSGTTELRLTPRTSDVSAGTAASISGSASFDAVPGYKAQTISLSSNASLTQYPVYSPPPAVTQAQSAYVTVVDPTQPLVLNFVFGTETVSFPMQNNVHSAIDSAVSLLLSRASIASASSTQITSTQWRIQFTFASPAAVSGVGFTITQSVLSQAAITKLYGARITASVERASTTFPVLPWPTTSIPPAVGGGGGGPQLSADVWLALGFESYPPVDLSQNHHSLAALPSGATIEPAGSRTGDGYALASTTQGTLNFNANLNELNGLTALTIEFDIFVPNAVGQAFFLGASGVVFSYAVANGATAFVATNGFITPLSSQSLTVTTNAWHHVALVGGASQCRAYVDGLLQFTAAGQPMGALDFAPSLGAGTPLGILNIATPPDTYPTLSGLGLDNVLFTKSEKYTTDFTPPGAITAGGPILSASSVYLKFEDGAGSSTLANSGSVGGPFSVAGGLVTAAQSRDGVGSFLTSATPGQATQFAAGGPGTGDYTVEMWLYFSATPSFVSMFAGNFYTGALFAYTNDSVGAFVGNWMASAPGSTPPGAWHHVAVVRQSGTARLYVGGTQYGEYVGDVSDVLAPFSLGDDGSYGVTTQVYVDEYRFTNAALYTANFTPQSPLQDLTPPPTTSDVQGAGYNDIASVTGTGAGNQQATFPPTYGSSSVTLSDFTADQSVVVDNNSINGTSTRTLANFTNTGSWVAALPTNLTGDVTVEDFTSNGSGLASTPIEITADYALDDFTSLAVGLFLARIDGSGDGMLEDAFIEDFAIDITTPVVAQLNADVPAATLNAEVSQYEGFKLSAKVPGAALASWFGMRFEKDVPRVAIQATGTIHNILRLDKTLPRVTIGANILDGRNFGLNADVPIASLSAWTGWMLGGVVPAALSSGSIVVGGAYQFNSTVPMSTCFGRVSTMNVLALAASVPAASRANWLAMSRAAPAANLVASVSLLQPVTRLAYSFTLANSAMSRYPAYPFIQIIRMGNAYFGAAEDGLYEIGGDADNGAAIPWAWETCMTDFGKAEKKTVVSAYLGGYVPLVMACTIKSGDAPTSVNAHTTTATAVLRNHRQKFGIGRKSRFFAFGLSATQGKVAIESVEFEVANMSRRV